MNAGGAGKYIVFRFAASGVFQRQPPTIGTDYDCYYGNWHCRYRFTITTEKLTISARYPTPTPPPPPPLSLPLALESCSTRMYKRFGEAVLMKDKSSCVSAKSAEFVTVGTVGSSACTRGFYIFLSHFLLPAGLTAANLDGVEIELYLAEQEQQVRASCTLRDRPNYTPH